MPEDHVRLRPATAEDVPAILALMDSVLDWLVARGRPDQWGTVPFSRVPGFPGRLAEWAGQGAFTVAERDGWCVGLIALAPGAPPRIPAGTVPDGALFVQTVLTDRGPGNRGVGSALMAEAERQARARGVSAVALDHWAGSPELDRFYDRHGYAKVAEYTEERDDRVVRNTVRVRRLGPETG
ncbi:GNAT family N-acetyltransferase [Rhizohabitans arisaemae]|uniref:GNAT family N-acetyltransferase n=1 Tax=Rhizohabitans arisaemae TaxID=2720610 RepID=UPI0024B237E6|nr:GNAT family N-acetyltransferase [Rhizohabitans arisaemae]